MKINISEELQETLVNGINEQEWITLTTEMVAIGQPNSTNPLDPDVPAGEEEAIALFVAGKLEAMGFEVSKHYSQEKRPNIVGVLKGTEDGPSLIINDHLDTYPAIAAAARLPIRNASSEAPRDVVALSTPHGGGSAFLFTVAKSLPIHETKAVFV